MAKNVIKIDFNVEFATASELLEWAQQLHKFGLGLEAALHDVAAELQNRLDKSPGVERQVAKKKSKKTSNTIRKAADGAHEISVAAVTLAKTFTTEYADLLEPKRNRRNQGIDFKN